MLYVCLNVSVPRAGLEEMLLLLCWHSSIPNNVASG